jgi:hypothetical protein
LEYLSCCESRQVVYDHLKEKEKESRPHGRDCRSMIGNKKEKDEEIRGQ